MKPTITTLRAIGAEFARRLWWPAAIAVTIISTLLFLLVWWISKEAGSLWLLLDIPLVVAVSIAVSLLALFKLIIKKVAPAMTPEQKQATKQFVDKLQSVSDAAQTPKVMLLIYLVRDVVSVKKDGFIGTLVTNTTSLSSDFQSLKKEFTAR